MYSYNVFYNRTLSSAIGCLKYFILISSLSHFYRSSDAVVNACVQNNLVATRTDLTVFEARKRLKSCHSAAVQAKLTQKQKRIFAINDALLLLGNQQVCCL